MYLQNHNVFKVNQTEFKECIKPPPNLVLTSWNDIIQLTSPGNKWYICGVRKHCSLFQQKLAINVLETNDPAPSPLP
ncbi:hypothetical protein CRG98_002250 [Punica granatum]|uniref:Phytocyanin domain-containing protein n=1 Tax=Punica granatum TaxID=22663 RepID=A0A2I0L9D1_PUNGR|nr:hypothetical protein CRG98_002250 [Punica granatum]